MALARLHAMAAAGADTGGPRIEPGYVHIDAAAAMSGVSRFGEAVVEEGVMADVQWRYSKDEDVAGDAMAGRGFDYLVGGRA